MFEDARSGAARHTAGTTRRRTSGSGVASAPAAPEPGTLLTLASRPPATRVEKMLGRLVELSDAALRSRPDGGMRAVETRWVRRAVPPFTDSAVMAGPSSPPASAVLPTGSAGSPARDGRGASPQEDRGASLAARLDAALPGAELAEWLASLEPADLDDHTLVEALAAWERVASWAQAGSARVLAELLERTAGSSGHELVADGVAARLGLTRSAAAQHVTVAHGTAHLPEVADALADGLVDRRKAEALIATGRLPDEQRRQAVRELLPDVEHLTVPQIRTRMRRAEIAVDPSGAEERHRVARTERYVRLEPVDDAMAYLTAYLPADDAVRAFAAVDELALAVRRGPGEERLLAECRADVLTGLLSGRLRAGDGADVADGDGSGRDVAGNDGVRRAVPVQPSGAASRRGGVRVSIAASTLLGSDDLPAILRGHGPVPAGTARALAGDPDAVWQRIFTDPGTGVLTDTSSRSYRPGARLRAAVVARDVTCTFPGCRVPASGCDLDHVEPFDPAVDGPQTHGDNLHALCRTHHRAKTSGGWRVSRDPATGVTRWTAPTGHQHDRPPEAHRPPEVPARPAGAEVRGATGQRRRPRGGSAGGHSPSSDPSSTA
ncbi:hypothetical protein GCM10007368_37890 [Isoptericola cucumis]|uniref:HNH nuclease domain-containing protein n=2 Tax=Isoptericola cucumis TaxID=1776856 RepID=A0ABQ2BBL0_9MICO|nr:hypothetical protein GCM10007368_37890 [Isoptericola cucumis]